MGRWATSEVCLTGKQPLNITGLLPLQFGDCHNKIGVLTPRIIFISKSGFNILHVKGFVSKLNILDTKENINV